MSQRTRRVNSSQLLHPPLQPPHRSTGETLPSRTDGEACQRFKAQTQTGARIKSRTDTCETGPDQNYFCPAALTFAALQSDVVYKYLTSQQKTSPVWRKAPQQSASTLELTSSESLFNIRLTSLQSPQKCSERVVVNQLLPTEKNKLMHGKWCNSTRAKSIHPERDREPTNEQRSRPSPSPTIIHLSSVGLRSSASLWFPSFLSCSSERKGEKSDPLALIPLSSPPV